jgi:pyruvate/2-oxoglutarate dehydrogenase complex dihydrolipoamide acyltransferase (E2) component
VSSSRIEGDPAAPGVADEEAAGVVSVEMPKMGISVSEGTILEWRKRPGDWVEADETICDVTTDKVDVEIPSPANGRLAKIVAEPGDIVPVGEPIAEIDSAAKPGESHPAEESNGATATPVAEAPAAEPPTPTDGEADRSRFYSPVVRRIADKHGVDLDQVEGTGIGGRVRKKDVLAFIEGGAAAAEPKERPLHIESPYKPDEPSPAPDAAPEPVGTAGNGRAAAAPEEVTAGRREPMSPMRQAIAQHMLDSRRTAAHVTTVVEVDMSRVAGRRAEQKEAMKRRGVPLTYLAFVAEATVQTLQEFPILNASIEGDEIVYHDDVNLGIAVALEPEGLIVPVIPKAQRLSLEGIAAAIADVAQRARSKQLQPDEVHGGTFTITNPGQFGAVIATPIINQPQVAILDLEAIVKRPVVVTTPRLLGSASGGDAVQESTDSIAIRPMAFLPLSFDHRALDGATAAKFLARVKARLESEGVE